MCLKDKCDVARSCHISKIEKNTYTLVLYEACKILLDLTFGNVRSNIIFYNLSKFTFRMRH